MKFKAITASILLITSAACTPRPESIAPVSMTGAFDHLSCSAARKQLDNERAALVSLEKKQNAAATADAIGVFLVLIPVSKLSGGDSAGEVGSAKGKVLALEQRVSRCK